MNKSSFALKLITLAVTGVASLLPMQESKADNTFQEVDVVQTNMIAVAQPLPPLFGIPRNNLIVIEQIPAKNTCWQEVGQNPVNVDLLLGDFDFSGHCRRATDANGYSMRYNGQDYGRTHTLTLVENNGVLQLVAVDIAGGGNSRVVIGSTTGMNAKAMKINLNPGWKFTRRAYQGNVLGHFYFSYQEPTATPSNTLPQGNSSPQGNMTEIVAPSN